MKGSAYWIVYDLQDGICGEYQTREEAVEKARSILQFYREEALKYGEWDQDVEGLFVAKVMHEAEVVGDGGGYDYRIGELI